MAQADNGGAVRPGRKSAIKPKKSEAAKIKPGARERNAHALNASGPEAREAGQQETGGQKPTKPIPSQQTPAKPKPKKPKSPKPKPAPLTRSEIMSRIKSRDTKPELMVRKALWAEGFRYRLHDRRLPGKPDLAFGRIKTALFVHGCFWHAHENCPNFRAPKSRQEYWAPKLERNKSRDLETKRKLEEEGWKVVTIWECQLSEPDWLEKLKAILKAGKGG